MRLLLKQSTRVLLPVLINASFIGLATSSVLAANYYVATNGSNSNPGTQDRPFATLSHATWQTKPGDTVYVRGGTYYFDREQYIGSTGTSSAPITYQSYPGEKAILDGSRTPQDTHVVNVAGQYNTFKEFEIANSKNTGIASWGGKNINILNNTVHDSYKGAIFVGKINNMTETANIKIDGNTVYRNGLINSNRNSSNAPAIVNSFGASNVTMSNNRVYQNYGEGIDFILTNGGVARGNVIYDNYSVNLYLDNASNITVEKNFIYTTNNSNFYRGGEPASGIQVANEGYEISNPLNKVTIRNNIVIGGSAGFFYGNYDRGGGMKNFVIANNTFYKATANMIFISNDAGHSNNLIANNIFYLSGSGIMANLTASSALKFRNNSWFGAIAGVAVGSGDVNADPKLVNPGSTVASDYKLQSSSPAINRGTALNEVKDDYAGVARPRGGTYDIGAYEY